MKLLVDTHCWLWLFDGGGPGGCSPPVRLADVADPDRDGLRATATVNELGLYFEHWYGPSKPNQATVFEQHPRRPVRLGSADGQGRGICESFEPGLSELNPPL